jgi:hypothetical protein
VYDRKPLTGTFIQRYIFTEKAGYGGMADTYRAYLQQKYSLEKISENGYPLALSLVGAIDRTVNIAGLPVEIEYPLTTYEQAAGIITDYKTAGAENLRVNLSGWFNGGIVHDSPTDIKLIGSLGGKQGFSQLMETAETQNAPVYTEADFTFIYDYSMFNGYRANRDSARRLGREIAEILPYSFVWFGEIEFNGGRLRDGYYLATPEYTVNTIDRFYNKLQTLGGRNISFGSIGRSVNSDFSTKNPVSTAEVIRMHQSKLAQLRENGAGVMIHGGFEYVIPYADFILDMELESKKYNIIDESIPFYQMALHGLVPYAGTPINLAPGYDHAILKSAETGAGLQFMFMQAPGESVQDTQYTQLFASDITRWSDRPMALYQKFNELLGHTVNQFITGHQKIADNVYQTEYEDGTCVLVNYRREPYVHEGITIDGMDFAVQR